MIVPQKRQLWRMLHHVGLPLFMLIGWDVIVVVTYKVMHWWWIGSSVIPPALYGSAIGIIVGFRNNSAYTRWCEARTLWGAIVNDSRSLARQVCTAPHINPGGGSATDLKAMQTRIVHPQIAYVHALRQQLRQLDPLETIRDILAAEELNRLAGNSNVAIGFDNGIYDVPLTSISTTIEINLRQLLGETNIPAPVAAVDSVLW